ncbi:MAG: ComF family protein [Gammaproteobacteria bacterium]|nr:ComF family protein [Gammaproteobacteria bacterium]
MLKRILRLIYPHHCVLCLSALHPGSHKTQELCVDCQQTLPLIDHSCYQCGIPLAHASDKQLCGQCLQKPPYFDHAISIYHYQNPLVWLIQQMKFNNKMLFARLLAQLFAEQLLLHQTQHRLPLPEAIIPVPLHYKRRYQRGFNQSEELARLIARQLDCFLDTQYIERRINSPQQSGLSARQRKKNVKGIFRVTNRQHKQYQHIAVVDDVMSTGSTVNELARLLKKTGIKKVDVWVLARASHD